MSNVIDSFLVALGFQTDTSGAEEYKKSLESVEKTVATVMGVATAAAGLIGWAVHKAAASMGELYSFAELNEVSARSLEALGKIAVENDGSLEGMKSTVQSLNKVIGEAALGIGRGAMTFEKLNLSAKNADGSVKNVDDILYDVADKMQGLSRQEQLALGSKLGIDPQFVKVLAQGSDNLRQLREEAELFNPFKEEDYELADKVDKLFTKASKSVGVFGKMVAVSLFPVIKQMLEGYLAFFKQFRKGGSEMFATALKVLVAVLQTMWDWTVRVVSSIKNAIQWFLQFKIVTWAAYAAMAAFVAIQTYNFFMSATKGLISLTRTMLAFNASALLIPALIGAVILAVALLIDEFVNFKEGNDSFLGDLVKEYPQLLDVINKISDGVSAVIDWVMKLFDQIAPALMDLGNALLNLFQTLSPVISFLVQAIGVVFMALLPVVLWVAQGIVNAIAWAIELCVSIVTGLVNAVTATFNWLSDKINAVVGAVKDAVAWVGKVTGLGSVQVAANAQQSGAAGAGMGADGSAANTLASNGPIGVAAGPQQGGTSNTTNTTTVNVPSIVVNSPDPTKAGQSVREELNKANRSSVRNGQSAVLL